MSDQPKKSPASELGRSVVDFVTPEELQKALQTVTPQGIASNDWILPVPDPEAEEQTLEGEMARLLNLQSFMLLDSEKEAAFDKLTEEACDVFGVPTSLISLIDLGRQFLFSNTGADVRETARDVAFCSHTILNKNGMIVVNDTKQDDRFKDSVLVNEAPHLRFYAGVPLVSPEGYKLGTFCVEGPEPRPEGLTTEEQAKLKDYASKAMTLMVERRKNLRDRLSGDSISSECLRHAAVTTNLGDLVYLAGDSVTAMRLFQESVQTVMQSEGETKDAKPDLERMKAMEQFMQLMAVPSIPKAAQLKLMGKIKNLYTDLPAIDKPLHIAEGILGPLFGFNSKLKGMNTPRPLPGLVFVETFKIDLDPSIQNKTFPLDDQPFTVSLGECSKATVFNMALIHYHWGSPDMALQLFHLAASVSHKISPLLFDPVDLAAINNMAQIHLQMRHPQDAMRMLTDALERGNKTLAALYSQTEPAPEVDTEEEEMDDPDAEEKKEQECASHTRRLRRKLARTLLNIGNVHFYNCDYDKAMASCYQAKPLLDDQMTGVTVAAVWYDMSMIFHHQGEHKEALDYLQKFLALAPKLIGPDHFQRADALYHQGQILFELGQDCMTPLHECLRIRKLNYGDCHGLVAETLALIGKVQLARGEVDAAAVALTHCVGVQRKLLEGNDLTFDTAQTLLDLARVHQSKGDMEAALNTYLEVIEWTRKFFGEKHAFVARIATIVGNLYAEAGHEDKAKPFLEEANHILKEQPVA